jgi:hypothetical protein
VLYQLSYLGPQSVAFTAHSRAELSKRLLRERRLIEARFRAVQNRSMAAAPNSIACFAALVAAFVLFFVFRHRRGIDAGEPAVQVDIGAAF